MEANGPLGDVSSRSPICGDRQLRPLEDLDEQVRTLVERRRETRPVPRKPLADRPFRRVGQDHRDFESAIALDEIGLAPRGLEMMPRVRLVSQGDDEVVGGHREVDVQFDPRTASSQVSVVGDPRLDP